MKGTATDSYPFTSALGWEKATWLAARHERLALSLVLTVIEQDGEITPARSMELAAWNSHAWCWAAMGRRCKW